MLFHTKLGKDDGSYEVNMTPLIDVSLVLVVMLLLATPLAFESSIGVRKSAPSTRTAERKAIEERIELRVLSEDMVKVNRAMVPRAALTSTLEPMLQESSERLVIVTCNDEVSHGTFVDVLDQVKLSGAAEIAVTGRSTR